MSKDVELYKRQIYTILDLLGDVGGLLDALKAFGSLLITLWFWLTGDPVSQFLIESIFKKEGKTKRKEEQGINDLHYFRALAHRKPFKLSRNFFVCLRNHKEKRIIEKSMQIVEKELEVDHFIKTMMQIRIMLKTLFTKTELFLINNNRRFVVHSESSNNQ